MPYSTDQYLKLTKMLFDLSKDAIDEEQIFELPGFDDADAELVREDACRRYNNTKESINLIAQTLGIDTRLQEQALHRQRPAYRRWETNQPISKRQRNNFYYLQLAANLLGHQKEGRDEEARLQWDLHGTQESLIAVGLAMWQQYTLPAPDPQPHRHALDATNIKMAAMGRAIVPTAHQLLDEGKTKAFEGLHQAVRDLRSYNDRVDFERATGVKSFDTLAHRAGERLNAAHANAQQNAGAASLANYADAEQSLNLLIQSTDTPLPFIDHWPNRFTGREPLPF